MPEYHVGQDYSGTLKSDLFFEFVVPEDSDLAHLVYPKQEGWEYISKRSPTELELAEEDTKAWLEVGILKQKLNRNKNCNTDPSHVTEVYFTELVLELFNSDEDEVILSEFNLTRPWFEMPGDEQATLVTKAFADRVRQSGLRGATFLPAKLNNSEQPANRKIPPLFAFQFQGKKCLRPFKVQGAENACPFCGRKPLICQECDFSYSTCPQCDQSAWTPLNKHGGPKDKSLIISPPEQREILVMEGKRWDGSDFVFANGIEFVNPGIISKRALDWLLSIHAAPFCARSLKFCTDGMSDQQRQQLEEIQKPIHS
ncbi:hypothetical protein [Gimesia sp.]|uniref:hypothetical protein n=1 Tax=Gimesia sp. TaxID=2024833 RepID=UPI003A8ECC74